MKKGKTFTGTVSLRIIYSKFSFFKGFISVILVKKNKFCKILQIKRKIGKA